MTTLHGRSARETLSPKIRQLKRAAAAARSDADEALAKAAHAVPAAAGIVPALLSRAGGTTLRAAARIVRRHPVSTVLIAAVLVGTALYHRSARPHGRGA